jgi:hypothetical protein
VDLERNMWNKHDRRVLQFPNLLSITFLIDK